MIFLLLLIFPVISAIAAFFLLKTVSWQEFLLGIGLQCCIVGVSIAIIFHQNTSDIEIWGGVVTSKEHERVHCSHSYRCHCYQSCSGSGKNRSCHQVCQTCYHHSYDVNWFLNTSNQEVVMINRVDWQGVHMPPRWERISLGEPTAVEHSYTNYIKGSPDSLFRRTASANYKVPEYPEVYDYYKIRRVLGDIKPSDYFAWDQELNALNSHIAKQKEVNVIIIFTKYDRKFLYAAQQKWLGGKDNDVVLIIGTQGYNIQWAEVMAWSQNSNLAINLKNDVMDIGVLDKAMVLKAINKNVLLYYKRKSPKDFEYLKSRIHPSTLQLTISMIIGMLVSGLLAFLFHRHDIFNTDTRRYSY